MTIPEPETGGVTQGVSVRCAWCRTELAPADTKPVKYARLPGASNAENMQCKDTAACQRRQDALDAAFIVRVRASGRGALFSPRSPGVVEAMADGGRLREAMAILDWETALDYSPP